MKFLKSIISLILLLFIQSNLSAQTDLKARYFLYGDSTNQDGEEIIYTSRGELAVIGSTNTPNPNGADVLVMVVDTNGQIIWQKSYGGPNIDRGYSIRETKDRGYILAGYTNSYGNGGYDMYIIKIDSLGNQLWESFGGGPDWDYAYDIVEKHDSGFYVCGSTYSYGSGNQDAYILELDKNGNFVNEWWWGEGKNDIFYACEVSVDSHYVFVGEITKDAQDSSDVLFVEFDKSGLIIRDTTYGGSGTDIAYDVIEIRDEQAYVIVGASTSIQVFASSPFLEAYFLKLNKDGSIKREDAYGNSGGTNKDETAYSVVELNNGQLAITGFTETFGAGEKDITLTFTNLDGWWTDASRNFGFAKNEYIVGIAIDKSETMFGVGFTNSIGNGHDDLLIFRVDTIIPTPLLPVFPDSIIITPFVVEVNISEQNSRLNISIYPNPSTEFLNINTSNERNHIEAIILDETGKMVWSSYFNTSTNFQINISQYQAGNYYLILSSGNEKARTIPFVKL